MTLETFEDAVHEVVGESEAEGLEGFEAAED